MLEVLCQECQLVGCVMLGVLCQECYVRSVILEVLCQECYVGSVMLEVLCQECYVRSVMLGVLCQQCYVRSVMLGVLCQECYVRSVMLGVLGVCCFKNVPSSLVPQTHQSQPHPSETVAVLPSFLSHRARGKIHTQRDHLQQNQPYTCTHFSYKLHPGDKACYLNSILL